jgi:phage tail-like protein
MTSPDLIANDPIVARSFYLDIPGVDKLLMNSVSGIEIELEVVSVSSNGKDAKQQHIKALGGTLKVPEITMTRMAPPQATSDPMWKWFLEIRNAGMKISARSAERKNVSLVLYDTAGTEVARYNFTNAWPSKIAIDQMSTDSNDPMKETITLQAERVDRIK